MSGIAALAVREVVVVSGFGSGLLAPSAVDGFAVGTLLSAVCLLMAIGPRRRLRRLRQVPITPSLRDGLPATASSARSEYSAVAMSSPLANESAKLTAAAERSGPAGGANAHDSNNNGYRSKHRLSDPDSSRRPESRRSAPRHAARAHRIGRMGSKVPVHPVPVRD